MGRKFKEEKVKKEKKTRRPIQKGDTFEYFVEFKLVDEDGDGLKDLKVTHYVKNLTTGLHVPRMPELVWEGFDEPTIAGFEDAVEKAGIVQGVQTFSRMKDCNKEWRKLTKCLGHINDFGDKFAADELGE